MKCRRAVMSVDDFEGQDSPLLTVMKHYGDPMTRDYYIAVAYLGTIDPDGPFPDDVEESWPEQFRRTTLVETPTVSDEIQ